MKPSHYPELGRPSLSTWASVLRTEAWPDGFAWERVCASISACRLFAYCWPRYLLWPRPIRIDDRRWDEDFPNCDLPDVARALKLPPHDLSQMLIWGPVAEATQGVPRFAPDDAEEFVLLIGPDLIAKHIELHLAGLPGPTVQWSKPVVPATASAPENSHRPQLSPPANRMSVA